MKLVVVLLVFAVASLSVRAETCLSVSDCVVTGCSAGGNLVCDDEGKCTCETSHNCTDGEDIGVHCNSARHCRNWYESAPNHKCECGDTHNLHCIDSRCKCGYPPN
ncbi:uncharacterized protein LOC121389904 [Gigantopelta aegis]|uniref:uncharacterized protein LOC121389904 n=1 Tax=Gigantopelta aegis TaxID=1735272 RepID=UPI001B88BA30|nr:uncharacterized protein LOC121389904 [Gigantopelta aegis]